MIWVVACLIAAVAALARLWWVSVCVTAELMAEVEYRVTQLERRVGHLVDDRLNNVDAPFGAK